MKEELEKRISELKQTLDQIQANGNATIGAIAECERWLKKLEAKSVEQVVINGADPQGRIAPQTSTSSQGI